MNATLSTQLLSNMDALVVKSFFKTKPYRHGLAIIGDWLIIFCAIYVYTQLSILWLYPLVVLIIGARIHALAVLAHDAAHYRFLRNRKWNDLITNFTIMFPIFMTLEQYRRNHLKHHQHLNTENDPDWVAKLSKRAFHFPQTRSAFLLTLASYLVFYQGIMDAIWFVKRYKVKEGTPTVRSTNNWTRVGFYVILLVLLGFFGLWKAFLLFWLVPYLTSFFMFQYIRSVAEHYGEMAHEDDLSSSRTVKPTLLERFFVSPHSVGYHLEHHLFAGVPFYHLPRLHRQLMEQDMYRHKAHITKGYLKGLLKELA